MYQLNPVLLENESTISELVKDKEWQKIRISLLNNWKVNPERNCKILRSYLDDISKCDNKKLKIVYNYLVGSGFRIGVIKHPCIQKLRDDIRFEIHKRNIKFR